MNLAKQKIIHVIKSVFLWKMFFIRATEYISTWCLPTHLKRYSWFQCQKVEWCCPNLHSWNRGNTWYSNKSAGWNFGYKFEVFVYCFNSKGKVIGSLNIQTAITKLPFVHPCSHFGRQKNFIFKVMVELEKYWISTSDCLSLEQTNKSIVGNTGEF